MKCIYIVRAVCGRYAEDRVTYSVCAYSDYEQALKKVSRCQRLNDKLIADIKAGVVNAFTVDSDSHPRYYREDTFMYEHEPTIYSVETVALKDHEGNRK